MSRRIGEALALIGRTEQFARDNLLAGALDQSPRYAKLRLAFHIAAIARKVYNNRRDIAGSLALAVLVDRQACGILPWFVGMVARVTSKYAVPAMAIATLLYLKFRSVPGYSELEQAPTTRLPSYFDQVQSMASRAHSAIALPGQMAQNLSFMLASSLTTEAATLGSGTMSKVIALLGESNPLDNIHDSDARIKLDKLEGMMQGGLNIGKVIRCLSFFNTHKAGILYHTASAVDQVTSRANKILNQIVGRLLDLNDHIKSLYIFLDQAEEQLLIKPGTLTQLFDRKVYDLYACFYIQGYPACADNEMPPFSHSRRRAAQDRMMDFKIDLDADLRKLQAYHREAKEQYQAMGAEFFSDSVWHEKVGLIESEISTAERRLVIEHDCFLEPARFVRNEETKWQIILSVVGCESFDYLALSAERLDNEMSAGQLVRLLALLEDEPEALYLNQYKDGQLTITDVIARCRELLTSLRASLTQTPVPACGLDLAGDAHSIESHLMIRSNQHIERVRQAGVDAIKTYIAAEVDAAEVEQYFNFKRDFTNLFSQSGSLSKVVEKKKPPRVTVAMLRLRSQALAVFSNHRLSTVDKRHLVANLILQYFPQPLMENLPEGEMLKITRLCRDGGADDSLVAALNAPDGMPLTIMQYHQSMAEDKAVTLFNFINKHSRNDDGLLAGPIVSAKWAYPCPLQSNVTQIATVMHSLLKKLNFSAFVSVEPAEEKEMGCLRAFLSTIDGLNANPYLRETMGVVRAYFFSSDVLVRQADEQLALDAAADAAGVEGASSGGGAPSDRHVLRVHSEFGLSRSPRAKSKPSKAYRDEHFDAYKLLCLDLSKVASGGEESMSRYVRQVWLHMPIPNKLSRRTQGYVKLCEIHKQCLMLEHEGQSTDIGAHPFWSMIAFVVEQYGHRGVNDASKLMMAMTAAASECVDGCRCAATLKRKDKWQAPDDDDPLLAASTTGM